MGYVIAGILVLLIVAAGVTVLVLNATKRQRGAAAEDTDYGEGTPGSDMAIVAADKNTPLGDTDQHAGTQTREGETVEGPEAGRGERGGSGGGEGGLGGEAEGSRDVTPESERLSDRPR
jgi:hypothetical protein